MKRTEELKIVPLDNLIPYANNSRTHSKEQIQKIRASLREYGFVNPVLIDKHRNIVAGHARVMAAKEEGITEVPCVLVEHLTETQIRSYVITDNRLAEDGQWSEERLAEELGFLQEQDFDVSLIGFSEEELATLLAGPQEDVVEDDPPEPPDDPITKRGDVWILGRHRVLCGDSANRIDVQRLMGSARAGCCITSPPYAMQRKDDYGGVAAEEYPGWFFRVARNVRDVLTDTGSFFVNIKEHVEDGQRSLYVMKTIIGMVEDGWRYVDQLIWTKPGLPGGWNNRLRNDFEPVHFFVKQEKIDWMIQLVDVDDSRLDLVDLGLVDQYEDVYHFTKAKKIKFKPRDVGQPSDKIRVYSSSNESQGESGNISVSGKFKKGIARPSNVLPITGNQESVKHSAVFPVKLPAFFIKLTTDVGDAVYEPFGGSGTTLIAAEQLGRTCYAMELSERYVDTIVNRWENLTGERAKLG